MVCSLPRLPPRRGSHDLPVAKSRAACPRRRPPRAGPARRPPRVRPHHVVRRRLRHHRGRLAPARNLARQQAPPIPLLPGHAQREHGLRCHQARSLRWHPAARTLSRKCDRRSRMARPWAPVQDLALRHQPRLTPMRARLWRRGNPRQESRACACSCACALLFGKTSSTPTKATRAAPVPSTARAPSSGCSRMGSAATRGEREGRTRRRGSSSSMGR